MFLLDAAKNVVNKTGSVMWTVGVKVALPLFSSVARILSSAGNALWTGPKAVEYVTGEKNNSISLYLSGGVILSATVLNIMTRIPKNFFAVWTLPKNDSDSQVQVNNGDNITQIIDIPGPPENNDEGSHAIIFAGLSQSQIIAINNGDDIAEEGSSDELYDHEKKLGIFGWIMYLSLAFLSSASSAYSLLGIYNNLMTVAEFMLEQVVDISKEEAHEGDNEYYIQTVVISIALFAWLSNILGPINMSIANAKKATMTLQDREKLKELKNERNTYYTIIATLISTAPSLGTIFYNTVFGALAKAPGANNLDINIKYAIGAFGSVSMYTNSILTQGPAIHAALEPKQNKLHYNEKFCLEKPAWIVTSISGVGNGVGTLTSNFTGLTGTSSAIFEVDNKNWGLIVGASFFSLAGAASDYLFSVNYSFNDVMNNFHKLYGHKPYTMVAQDDKGREQEKGEIEKLRQVIIIRQDTYSEATSSTLFKPKPSMSDIILPTIDVPSLTWNLTK